LLKTAARECNNDHHYYINALHLLAFQLLDTIPRRAIKLLKSASCKQHVEATFRIASLFADGEVVGIDLVQAASLFQLTRLFISNPKQGRRRKITRNERHQIQIAAERPVSAHSENDTAALLLRRRVAAAFALHTLFNFIRRFN
jgi:hypothetical protein